MKGVSLLSPLPARSAGATRLSFLGFVKPGDELVSVVTLQEGRDVTFACLSLVVADVKTRKWSFLLEEYSKLSELPALLVFIMLLLSLNHMPRA